ncbi:MAG: hypothetical protein QOD35_2165 [Nocardioidaceae bacterium]|nr:hypothetical protein [Nocardioidaceae bacterium]
MSSDALTHLVQRVLRPEPAVAPRLPSAYESSGSAQAELERSEETPVWRSPVQSSAEEGSEPPPRRARRRPATDEGSPSPRSNGRLVENLPSDLPGSAAPVVAEPEPDAARTPTAPELERQRSAVGIRHGVITSRPGPDTAPGLTPPRPVEPVSSPEPSRPLTDATRETVARVPALVPVTAVPPEQPRRPESEPVVSITIGRVEVRTAASSTSARPPRQPPDRRVMSLEEYLDRRARGAP